MRRWRQVASEDRVGQGGSHTRIIEGFQARADLGEALCHKCIRSFGSIGYSAPMQALSREGDCPFELINPRGDPRFLVICDHASNALPSGYGSLGLDAREFSRHIAYDIGAGAVARRLADKLDCPVVLARFSRLLIDLNRGADDPTLVMKLSDGAIIPANRDVDAFRGAAEFARRLKDFYEPYHAAVTGALERAKARGAVPAIFSIHSFTPIWRGIARPWHAGILWDKDDRLPMPLLEGLRGEPGLVVGDNEPYSGALKGDCLYRHGTRNGLPHALVEIRQDLIDDARGQEEWAARLARLVPLIAANADLSAVRHYGSRTDNR